MELTQDQVRAFVGDKAEYYLERWHHIHPFWGSPALGFNWAAFFLTGPWLIYRRMYRTFSIAMLIWLALQISLVLVLTVALYSEAKLFAFLLIMLMAATGLALPVIFGVYGTYWYYLHARRQVSSLSPEGQTDLGVIAGLGGINFWGGFTSVAVFTLLYTVGKILNSQ
jgi:hypothetical protein